MPEKDDYEISDEDLEFFAENKGFTSFLSNLDAKELTRYIHEKGAILTLTKQINTEIQSRNQKHLSKSQL